MAGSGSETITNPRTLSGVVVSNKAAKTLVVKVERRVQHPLYKKVIRRSTKVHAHDERSEGQIGDTVTVRESRPISKRKTWQLVSIDDRPRRV